MGYFRKFAFLIFFLCPLLTIASEVDDIYSFCVKNGSLLEAGGVAYKDLEPRKIIRKCTPLKKKINEKDQRYDELNYILGRSHLKAKEYKEAFNFFENSKHPDSKNNLGVMYNRGQGVKTDNKKAHNYFLEAEKEGSNVASLNLAHNYIYGIGVEKSIKKGIEKAEKLSNNKFYKNLANYYLAKAHELNENYSESLYFYEKSHQGNNLLVASKKLAGILYGSDFNFPKKYKDSKKAIKLWREIFHHHQDIDAAIKISEAIKNGIVKPKYKNERNDLLRKAAQENDVFAALELSDHYFNKKTKLGNEKALNYAKEAYFSYMKEIDSENSFAANFSSIIYKIKKGESLTKTKSQNKNIRELVDNYNHKKFKLDKRKIEVTFNCGSHKGSKDYLYLENTGYNYPFVNHQIQWFDKVRGCKIDEETENKIKNAFSLAKEKNLKFTQVALMSLTGSYKTEAEGSIYHAKNGKEFVIGNGYVIDNGMIKDEILVKLRSVTNEIAIVSHQKNSSEKLSINVANLYTRPEFEAMHSNRKGWAIAGGAVAAALGLWIASDDENDLTSNELFEKRCKAKSSSGSLIRRARICYVESEFGWFGGEKKCVCNEVGY